MVKKKEKKGGKKRATGETKKSSRRDKEARDRLKRFLKKRAPDLSISTALDIQFPALVSLLRVREFGALALSSKENLARTASRPFLAALTNVPILQSPAVLRRIESAPWPGHEVLKIIFMRWGGDEAGESPEYNFECVVEVLLKNGERIAERGYLEDGCEGGDFEDLTYACVLKLRHETIVLEAPRNFNERGLRYKSDQSDDESTQSLISTGSTGSYWAERTGNEPHDPNDEFWTFNKQTENIGKARVTLVRDDGKLLRLFSGPVAALIPGFENEEYRWDFPYEVPRHDQCCEDDPVHCNAGIYTTDSRKEHGKNVYRAKGLEINFRWTREDPGEYSFGRGLPNRPLFSKDHTLGLLHFIGDWR